MLQPPGVWSSQRHWHSSEDEFIYVLQGERIMITDAGEELLKVGDCASCKAGTADGHHLQDQSIAAAMFTLAATRIRTRSRVVRQSIDNV